jgi:hypothetical protein
MRSTYRQHTFLLLYELILGIPKPLEFSNMPLLDILQLLRMLLLQLSDYPSVLLSRDRSHRPKLLRFLLGSRHKLLHKPTTTQRLQVKTLEKQQDKGEGILTLEYLNNPENYSFIFFTSASVSKGSSTSSGLVPLVTDSC